MDTNGSVAWQVEVDRDYVHLSSYPDAEAIGNFLVIAMPENYVLPGTSGRRTILCINVVTDQQLEARLASPSKRVEASFSHNEIHVAMYHWLIFFLVLQMPLFSNATVNEGDLLEVTCVSRNIPDITTVEVLDPNGMPVPTVLGVLSMPNVTCSYAGTYTCVVTSTLDNSTVNETSEVTIECYSKV